MQNRPLVTIGERKTSIEDVEVLNDLTAQFLDVSTRVFEIEEQLGNLQKIVLELIERF